MTGPFEQPGEVQLGERLEEKWELLEKLGAGGMGSVYLARDLALDRKVAIKVLALAHGADPDLVIRFEREARVMAQLDHVNLVAVYGVGKRQGLPFIVMKNLEGQSLSKFLRTRKAKGLPLELREIRIILEQLCAGLGYLHGKGYIHRDIKPANLFVGPDGRITILDLGIARTQQRELTKTGMVLGSPRYMAPEQIYAREIDARSDLYSLGIVLYEMCTGAVPFDSDSEFAILRQHAEDAPPDPRTRNPMLPEAVAQVLEKSLAKAPSLRYQTADELLRDFVSASEGRAPLGGELSGPGASPTSTLTGVDVNLRDLTPHSGVSASTTSPLPDEDATGIVSPPTGATPGPQSSGSSRTTVTRPPASAQMLETQPPQRPERAGGLGRIAAVVAFVLLCAGAGAAGMYGIHRLGTSDTAGAPVAPAAPPASNDGEQAAAPASTPRSDETPKPPGPIAAAPAPSPVEALEPEPEAAAEKTEAVLPTVAKSSAKSKTVVASKRTATAEPRPSGDSSGQLRVTTTSSGKLTWAWVDVNGARRGSTPLTLELGAGQHEVEISRPGFRTESQSVQVRSGALTPVQVALTQE